MFSDLYNDKTLDPMPLWKPPVWHPLSYMDKSALTHVAVLHLSEVDCLIIAVY